MTATDDRRSLRPVFEFGIYALVLGCIIAAANLGGAADYFQLVRDLPYGDKLGHFVLMGVLALLADRALGRRTVGRLPLGPTLVVLFVVAEEMSQLFVERRTFDLVDLAADFAGIALFTTLGRVLFKAPRSRRTAEPPATRSPDS